MLSRIKFEITPLVNEMLDQWPASTWLSTDSTFLDPAIAGGQFVREIERRLREAGHSDENIHSRVFGVEQFPHQIAYAVNKYDLKGQYVVGDFLTMEFSMKFDNIVGNPPFQGREVNSDSALWLQFTNKGMSLLKPNGILGFISPTSWVGKISRSKKADFSAFIKNRVVLFKSLSEEERTKYFSVGSTIGYFLLQAGTGDTTLVLSDGTSRQYIIKPGVPLPRPLTPLGFSIHSKIEACKKLVVTQNCSFHSQRLKKLGMVNDAQTAKFKYKTHFSHNLIRFTNEKQNVYANMKVMIPSVGTLGNAWYDKNVNVTEDVSYILVDDELQAKRLLAVLKSALVTYIGQRYRPGRNLGVVIGFIPDLALSKDWTNKTIYKHFGLTPEEIAYVEANVK